MVSFDVIAEILNIKRITKAANQIANCPFCNKEKHFYINRFNRLWDCKKCGEKGNEFQLLTKLGYGHLLEDQGKTISTVQMKKAEIWALAETEDKIKDLPKIEERKLPIGWKRVFENDYLERRGLDIYDFLKYRIGMTKLLSKLEDYVIFVIEEDGLVVGWVGRYTGTNVDLLRYRNSKKTKFSDLLFGYNELTNNTTTIIMVEGIFDKIRIDKAFKLDDSDEIKCLCTFGKKISDNQIQKLKKFESINKSILCFDYDAVKEMKNYSFELKKNWDTTITYTTKKDVDECSDDEIFEIFSNQKTPQEFFMKTMRKL